MNVTYFAKYSRSGPSSRYRIFQFLDAFREADVQVTIQSLFEEHYFELLRTNSGPLPKIPYTARRFLERAQTTSHVEQSLVVIEHQLFPYVPFVFENRFLPQRYVLEFDDAIYLTHPQKFPKMLQHAEAVIAGNHNLAEFARKHNRNVHIIPTVLDTDTFRPVEKAPHDLVRIGWSGLEYNFKYLRILEPVFQKLLKHHAIEIVILSGSPPKDFKFPFRFIPWGSNREVEQMNEFDIGVMPLTDDEWTRGKCGMKLLQYMALEIPSVAAPVGVIQEILDDRINGFQARHESEWEGVLAELIQNAQLRKKVGEEARRTVVDRYSMKVWFPKLLEVYRRYADVDLSEEPMVFNARN